MRCSICGKVPDTAGVAHVDSDERRGHHSVVAEGILYHLEDERDCVQAHPPRSRNSEELQNREEVSDAGGPGDADSDLGQRAPPLAAKQALVGRSLEFAGVTACFAGDAYDEWVAAVDGTAFPSEEATVRLELLNAYCSPPPPSPPYPPQDNVQGEGLQVVAGNLTRSGSAAPYAASGGSNLCVVTDDWEVEDDVVMISPAPNVLADATLPPEARPPWENAATVNSTLVVCERLLPAPCSASVAVPREQSFRRTLRPRR